MFQKNVNLLKSIPFLLLVVPAWIGFQSLPWWEDEEPAREVLGFY